jgi:hypothetical protein
VQRALVRALGGIGGVTLSLFIFFFKLDSKSSVPLSPTPLSRASRCLQGVPCQLEPPRATNVPKSCWTISGATLLISTRVLQHTMPASGRSVRLQEATRRSHTRRSPLTTSELSLTRSAKGALRRRGRSRRTLSGSSTFLEKVQIRRRNLLYFSRRSRYDCITDQWGVFLILSPYQGRTEKYLLDLPAESGIQASILRPGWFLPSKEDANIRSRTMITKALYPVVSTLVPSVCTPVEGLGRVTVEIAKGKWDEERLFRNARLRELM